MPLSLRARLALLLTAATLAASALHAQSVPPLPYTTAYQGAQPSLVKPLATEPATSLPRIRHAYMAAPDVLAVVVDTQSLKNFPAIKYEKRPGDTIRYARPIPYGPEGTTPFYWGRTIIRDGKPLGEIVGFDNANYIPNPTYSGETLDTTRADNPANYALTSPADTNPLTPISVSRKTKPEAIEWISGKQEFSNRHEIFLKFSKPLTPGQTYTLSFLNNPQFPTPLTLTFDDTRLRTEAIQVNQVGYHPAQAERLAKLSIWLGSGGGVDFSAFKTFNVVDDKTSAVVFTGPITLRKAGNPAKTMAPERTPDANDDLPTSVYHLDFTPFKTPGTYRITVPGLGTSFPFRIDTAVWETSAKIAAHGYLNQRSGIALGPPYTEYKRPRNFHPADGVPIFKTDPVAFYDPVKFAGGGNPFKRIQASLQLNTNVPDAWGGWHDAADFDRSIAPQNHARAVQVMLWLHHANTAYVEKLSLNIPESNNKIPDLLDEALWCMDLFLRIQQPDGGIPSAVESTEHPSEPSYLHALPTAVTPPTPQTCHLYAAAAAQLSVALEKYDPARAKTYRDSALRALAWADNNTSVPNIYARNLLPADQHEAVAYLWAYRLTNDKNWHDRLKQSFAKMFPDGKITFADPEYAGPWAFMDYLLLPESMTDAALRTKCRAAVIEHADAKVNAINAYTYYLSSSRYNWDERLGQHWQIAMAHKLTNDPKYLLAMERQANLALGLNPNNTSYTTGLGSRQVVPFYIDAYHLGVPIPAGITTIGPAPRNSWAGERIEKKLQMGSLHPEWKFWPWAESNFNYKEPMINEYVVGSNFANVLLTRTYLAQTYATPPKSK